MTKPRNGVHLSQLAPMLGLSLQRLYSLARLPDSPNPVDFPGSLAVYDVAQWRDYLATGTYKAVEDVSDGAG